MSLRDSMYLVCRWTAIIVAGVLLGSALFYLEGVVRSAYTTTSEQPLAQGDREITLPRNHPRRYQFDDIRDKPEDCRYDAYADFGEGVSPRYLCYSDQY